MVPNIHAVGRNYVKHIEELQNEIPDEPVIFSKSPSCLTKASQLTFPVQAQPVHFELELVLRMGQDLDIGAFRDLGSVSHVGLGIDFTAREWQGRLKKKGLPWHMAKNFQNACWLGSLKAGSPNSAYQFQLYQNDALQQDGDSTHMIYPFQKVLSWINRTIPLNEGDLIYTGTPAGVGPTIPGDKLRVVCQTLETDQEISIL